MSPRNVILTAGGTAGHVFPAMAVGSLLRERGHSVLFLGDGRLGDYATQSGFPHRLVTSGRNLKSFKSLFSVLQGIWQSFRIIRNFKADAVIGFGSYVTFPILTAAALTRTAIYLHEQNLFVGDANKFFLSHGKRIFTSLQETYGVRIDYSGKICFSGNPVREEVRRLRDAPAYRRPEPCGAVNILITGGSGGASFMATELLEAFHFLGEKTKKRIRVSHQVKEAGELEMVRLFYDREMIEGEVRLFFQDMPLRILQSHLVIARSGMGTISELAMVGRPAILIPSPNVKNNHQLHNARFFERSGGCLVVEESTFRPEKFASDLEFLIADGEKLEELASNMRKLAVLDAEERIVQQLESDLGQLDH
ncbi:MAG: UDP-N-acetylglucosamine--N-acetylmuramyl-(pentapeptide) pyrophosphoryl-undecaprenol N-acetylglucosamine transferase [Rickettsiales bacterium]|nr:UDP-N-acetylglucosamine--N-acetylmuramyl-(pentapeptide) pyrophosphoryl-undecaprenol N-acetylglucosamine transferase [Rickettsiales bacterium]